jgi:hypothetical protein
MSKNIFDTDDYNSPDGMMTSIWGPPLWHTLHTISFNYPVNPTKEDKINYYNFFISLKNILPCKYCRDNLKANLKINPLNKKVFSIHNQNTTKPESKVISKNIKHFNTQKYKSIEIIDIINKNIKKTYNQNDNY